MIVKLSQSADSPPTSQPKIVWKRPIKHRLTQAVALLLCLGLFTGGGYALYRQFVLVPQQQGRARTRTVSVETHTLPIIVSANGVVEPEQLTNVSPKNSGRLERIVVEEGDTVEAGRILAYMDDSDLEGQLIQAQGQLAAGQANLSRLVAGNRPQEIAQVAADLASAEASLRQAEEDLRRYEALYTQGAISAQEVTTYRTARDTAQAQVEAVQQALDLSQTGSRQEEIDQAKAEVTQANGSLIIIQTQIEDTVIRAPFSGVVTARYADPGDFVAPTTTASDTSSSSSSSILALASNYQVVANVAETDIARIQAGQSVSIRADAYPDQMFAGEVVQVAEQATVTSNVTSFEVRVNLSEAAQAQLRPGMNVDVEFQAGELTHVLVVPTVAIMRQDQGEGVLVMTEAGVPQFRPIETGLTVDNQTEIRAGLKGDEQIVLSAAEGLPTRRQNFGGNRMSPFGGGPPR